MKYIYRVSFIGRGKGSLGHTVELRKTLVFDKVTDLEGIRLKLYETHEHIRVLSVRDLSKAAIHSEVK